MDDLLDDAPCSFFAFDDDGKIAAANRTAAEMLGYSQGELLGLPLSSVLEGADRILYQTYLFPLLKLEGKADEIQLSLATRSGDQVPMLVSAARKEHEEGSLNHCVMIPVPRRRKYEDEILQARRAAEEAVKNNDELDRTKQELELYATELDRKLAALEQKNQELARVSQVLSHDVREPIRQIAWFAEVLRDENGPELGVSGGDWVEKIIAACLRADRLLHLLREFVSLDAEPGGLEEVDLNEALAAATREMAANGESVELQLEGESLPTVHGVRRQLVVLFRNLLQNALERRAPGVEPCVHVGRSVVKQNSFRMIAGKYRYDDFARIVLRDNGMGLAGEETVFDPLSNVRSSSSNGFGLAMCRKVVENHHGRISVTSKPSKGTAFTILLPLRT